LILLLVIIAALPACKQKEYTLAELQKAKWDSLSPGVYYLSTNNHSGSKDSVEIMLKGISGTETNPIEMSFTTIPKENSALVTEEVKKYLQGSKAGYLKINFIDMLKPDTLKAIVYLRGDYDTILLLRQDSAVLKNIPGIREVHFISKEMASKKYMDQGNSDWNKVLEANPFPNSFEITLDSKEWDSASAEKLKSNIHDGLVIASDISFPSFLYEKNDTYFFFEYKFK